MKEFKTFNQQLKILRQRGLIVPKNGKPKRFLEQENYYNVINGYKDLFLQKDEANKPLVPDRFLTGAHFDELKSLFLFDRELRSIFLKYILILENSIKTTLAHEFCHSYPNPNSYLDIKNYNDANPKFVLKQISILTSKTHEKVDKKGPIKHYIEKHGAVPFWVLVNYLTMGNISYLYAVLKDEDKNNVAKFYAEKFNNQYRKSNKLNFSPAYMQAALKVINLVRNKCAHDERLYNINLKNVKIEKIAKYFSLNYCDNSKIIVLILYMKVLLDKNYYNDFHTSLEDLFVKYNEDFKTVKFDEILDEMGVRKAELEKLKE